MFKDKVAVITGGASGIGACIARMFREQGAKVCIIDVKPGDHFVGDISDPKVLEALTSEEGTLLRMNRSIQVEGVFGVLKEDYGFRRFLTRGKKNVETQFFLLAFALNIEKLCNREKKGRLGLDLFPLNAS